MMTKLTNNPRISLEEATKIATCHSEDEDVVRVPWK